MGWTTPRTWVAGEPLTAGQLNEQVRDNLNVLAPFAAPWGTFTPEWTAGTTNPSIGNGSIVGRYMQIGTTIFFSTMLTIGSTTNLGSGTYSFGLPLPARSSTAVIISAFQNAPNQALVGRGASTTAYFLYRTDTSVSMGPSSTSLTAGSTIMASGVYEGA